MSYSPVGFVGPATMGTPARLQAICEAVESLFGSTITSRVTDAGSVAQLEDRESFIQAQFGDVQRQYTPTLCNGDASQSIAVSRNSYSDVAGPRGTGGHIVTITVPTSDGIAMRRLISTVAEEIDPYYAAWLPHAAAAALNPVIFTNVSVPGLSPASRDAWLMERSCELKNGGWLIQLTPEILDVKNPRHQATLQSAYQRFSRIVEG